MFETSQSRSPNNRSNQMFGIFADVFKTATGTNEKDRFYRDADYYHHEERKRRELQRQNDLKWFFQPRG